MRLYTTYLAYFSKLFFYNFFFPFFAPYTVCNILLKGAAMITRVGFRNFASNREISHIITKHLYIPYTFLIVRILTFHFHFLLCIILIPLENLLNFSTLQNPF